jgi:flagellar biosynthesis/type III secretory pathway ATPase
LIIRLFGSARVWSTDSSIAIASNARSARFAKICHTSFADVVESEYMMRRIEPRPVVRTTGTDLKRASHARPHLTRVENEMEQKAMDGRVIAVRGAVVDVAFDGAALPPIDDALVIMPDGGAPITVEVQAHLNESTVRGIALQSTMGLSRGVPARATGGPIEVTVGESVLGRLLDVTGAVGDKGAAFPADAPRRPIHRAPPPLASQSASTDIFSTGIKVIDLFTPLAQGGKAAMLPGSARPFSSWS